MHEICTARTSNIYILPNQTGQFIEFIHLAFLSKHLKKKVRQNFDWPNSSKCTTSKTLPTKQYFTGARSSWNRNEWEFHKSLEFSLVGRWKASIFRAFALHVYAFSTIFTVSTAAFLFPSFFVWFSIGTINSVVNVHCMWTRRITNVTSS